MSGRGLGMGGERLGKRTIVLAGTDYREEKGERA